MEIDARKKVSMEEGKRGILMTRRRECMGCASKEELSREWEKEREREKLSKRTGRSTEHNSGSRRP